MKIGNVEVGQLILGPMAGFTDMPFRALCIEQGASFTCTEMISAKALFYKNKNTLPLLQTGDGEHPVAVQLFGSDAELLAEEAEKLEDGPFDVFDVNMGCPVQKVVGNGEGSALMRSPERVKEIVHAMAGKLQKPVTVKIRKGFNDAEINAVEIAKIAEGEGAAAVAVHGRTREEFYRGKADWDIIAQVKEAVKIPVIGSGDVFSGPDAKRMLDETGCDAVMIARGARGNPWIFRQIRHYLETGEELPKPALSEVREMILRHARMMIDFEERMFPETIRSRGGAQRQRNNDSRVSAAEDAAIRMMRKHLGFYVTGCRDASHIRRRVNSCSTYAELEAIMDEWTKGDND